MNNIIYRSSHWIVVFLVVVSFVGCSGKPTSAYIPRSSSAKEALQRSLDAWKSGKPHGTLTDRSPAIDVFDARWQAGRKLESFTIGNEIVGQEHPMFKVTLKVEGENETEDTSFHIVGIDPLHVFRNADFLKATGQ